MKPCTKTNKLVITHMWVSEHTGIKGNELAEKQAKFATTNPEFNIIPGPSYNDLKRYINDITNTK